MIRLVFWTVLWLQVKMSVSRSVGGKKDGKKEKQVLTKCRIPVIITLLWGYSSAGRALEWHSRGQRFDPAYLHQRDVKKACFRKKTSLSLF